MVSIPLNQQLIEARAKAAQIRRIAFVDAPVMVLRFSLRPITLATYNALMAEGNAFAVPGQQVRVKDIASFVWMHSPSCDPFNLRAKRRMFRRVRRAIYPLGYKLNDGLRSRFPTNRLVAALTRFPSAIRVCGSRE